ncbi:uncharacterized protein LOC122880118 [Siniperca chuatsi]|uniref:uncharacterized protein LOC122880118 n=1 Tax=Siniperca chuatsi TaxID=119488 RepID=UPI001CE1807C|nr:uncharacterized protein LOC122880118 [Siniperca chuatsi]
MAKKYTVSEVLAAILESSNKDEGGVSEPEGFDFDDEGEYQNNRDPFKDGADSPLPGPSEPQAASPLPATRSPPAPPPQPGQPRSPMPPEHKHLPHSHQYPMYQRPYLHSSQLSCLGRQTKTWTPLQLSPGFNQLGHQEHSSAPPPHINPSTCSNFSLVESSNYTGKSDIRSGHGLSYDVVMSLVQPGYLSTGYQIYITLLFCSMA